MKGVQPSSHAGQGPQPVQVPVLVERVAQQIGVAAGAQQAAVLQRVAAQQPRLIGGEGPYQLGHPRLVGGQRPVGLREPGVEVVGELGQIQRLPREAAGGCRR